MAIIAATATIASSSRFIFRVRCSDSDVTRGFGSKKTEKMAKTKEDNKGMVSKTRKSPANRSVSAPRKAPGLNSQFDGRSNELLDLDFEERLEAIRRSALEKKQVEKIEEFGAIDYDAPIKAEEKSIGLGAKIGAGIAIAVFGLVFALGDFFPSESPSPTKDTMVVNKLSEEQKVSLQNRLKDYEAILSNSPKDSAALEGSAVTLVELGEYARAASLLQDLTKDRPNDPDAFRLLGDVKYELKDYDGSVAAYKSSAMVSKDMDFEVIRGITNALLAAKKPDEAVQYLLASRERLSTVNSNSFDSKMGSSSAVNTKLNIDPVQVELLLGKAYSDWGHISDAVTVYDRLIAAYPTDFRGYLAKGIILKENGSVGDAERMFIQARFFAPENAKPLVDRYSR